MAVSPIPFLEERALEQIRRIAAGLPDPQRDLPRLARDSSIRSVIEAAVMEVPTSHRLMVGDARHLGAFADQSVHLVVTSPPYGRSRSTTPARGNLATSTTTSPSSISWT
jgi:hypothetical protein